MSDPPRQGTFPIEIMLSIFSNLDGDMLCECKRTCRLWKSAIDHYDQLIWEPACNRLVLDQRFRSIEFPARPEHCTHQDMYRVTWNWYRGQCQAYYPEINTSNNGKACLVVGAVQEQGMPTVLTVSNDHRIIRSNPTYHHPSGAQRLVIQCPMEPFTRFFLEETWIPPQHADPGLRTIVCHYSHPDISYLATGSLNGTVSVWDLEKKKLVRVWHGHRGRVLCISMNDKVVVSGGSDNIIRVWDLDERKADESSTDDWIHHHRQTRRRGMIEVSKYLSSEQWYQGIGEIAVNGNLIACVPDASSGPILVFSLLTGSRVYELKENAIDQFSEYMMQDVRGQSCLCLTPFFLLTKAKVINDHHQNIKLVPSHHNVVLQRTNKKKTKQSIGYISRLSDVQMPSNSHHHSEMTPYQLYQYYNNNNNEQQDHQATKPMPETSACINVWDLQNGKLIYRLVPVLKDPTQYYTITDIKVSPDYTKVFCSIDIRENQGYQEYLYCWDFDTIQHTKMGFVELDTLDPTSRTSGKSWVCFM